jgi:hypothetical protein
MKLKKMSISIVFIMAALSLCVLPGKANAYDCKKCTITRLGMNPGAFGTTDGFFVQLDDADNEWTGPMVFYLSDTLGKAGWATVLTGYSLGKTMWVRMVDTTPGSLITIVYIND